MRTGGTLLLCALRPCRFRLVLIQRRWLAACRQSIDLQYIVTGFGYGPRMNIVDYSRIWMGGAKGGSGLSGSSTSPTSVLDVNLTASGVTRAAARHFETPRTR